MVESRLAPQRVLGKRLAASYPRAPLDAAAGTSATADRIAWAVNGASRVVPKAGTCLPRALAAHRMLARRGLAPALRIGARVTETGFGAHAWVECDGRVVMGDLRDLATFKPLAPAAWRA